MRRRTERRGVALRGQGERSFCFEEESMVLTVNVLVCLLSESTLWLSRS